MGIEDLTQLEILQAFTSLIYAITGTIVGGIIASKYFKHRKPELLGIGLSLVILTFPWYGGGISFLTYVFFDFILPDTLYFLINYGLIAFALIFWIYGISILLSKNVKRNTTITAIISLTYEVVFLYLLITNISMVGVKEGRFNSDAALFPTIFVVFALLITLITMLMFIRVCFRSEDLKIKWKGRFLLIATLLLIIGSFMDATITLTPETLITARIILMLRLIFSYLGWLLPDRVAKWLIKEE